MIGKIQLRNLLEDHGGDRAACGAELLHFVGLTDRHGNRYRDRNGQQTLRDPADGHPRLRLADCSLRNLAEEFIGEDAVERWLNPNVTRVLQESSGAAIPPSVFSNINAFTGVTAGLMEVAILEGYQNPMFIGDKLMPTESSRQFEGRKTIGVSRAGDVAEERAPGAPTARAKIGERWITQPRTVENSLAIEILQETVYLDLTGQVTSEANDLGTWVRYRKELRQIDAFIGVTNNYNYKGSSYNTYLTSGSWVNDVTSNELVTHENIKTAEIKFRDMTDPETGTRILTNPNAVLVQREYLDRMTALLGAPNLQYQQTPELGSTAIRRAVDGPSVYAGKYEIIESPLVFERIDATDGLNQTAAAAAKYWWMYEKGKPFVYVENWPLRVQTAAPGQLDMIDRGIVLYVKADERGVPMVREPRGVVRCSG